MSYYCENCEKRGETTEREVDRLREVEERLHAEVAEYSRAMMQEEREKNAALAEVARLTAENDWLRAYTGQSAKACVYCGLGADEQGKCNRGFPGCARADDQMLCREVEVAMERDELRAEVARLTAERERGTAALRVAFGEELWQLGHPAYVVVHLRDEIEKVTRLWKASTVENAALLARVEAAELDAARYRWLTSDHNDPWVRQHCREILERMGVMSYSATSTAIDTALEIEQFHAIDAAMEGGK